MAGRRRGFETLGDMARSLGVVLAVVLVLVLITWRTKGSEIRLVDYAPTLAQAKVGAPFVLLAPVGLSSGWRATSFYFDPPERTGVPGVTLWHIGYVTPADQYAGMEQTNGPGHDALVTAITGPRADGTSSVGGVSWARWTSADGKRRALTQTTGKVTVVVDGTAGWPELEELVGSLRPQT